MKRIFSFLLLLLVGALGSIAALEVFLRATGYSQPIWYQADPQLGWSLRPGVRGKYVQEGQSTVRISPAGMRDRSHAVEKPRATYRIAVLGDSFAEAMQVEYKESFVWHLEQKLAACKFRPGEEVEVLNFGVSGYGLAEAERLLATRALKYSPDLVLLVFGHGGASKPDAVQVVEVPEPWQELLWLGSDRLRSVQFFTSLYHRGVIQSAQASASAPSQPRADALQKIRDTAVRGGASVAMVTLGPAPKDLQGITAIPLDEEMRRIAQQEQAALSGFRNSPPQQRPAHWNERGHRAAAELIARRLCAQAPAR